MPKAAEPWSLTSLREKLTKIGARVVSHGRRYVTVQMAEFAALQQVFADILLLISRLQAPPARHEERRYEIRQTTTARCAFKRARQP